jgi:hypothetical protein
VGRAVEVVSCYEAGYDGFRLHRRLQARGVAQLRDRSGKPAGGPPGTTAKTEPTDADRLLRLLMAYLRGEPKVRSAVRVPGIVEEDSANAFSTSTASPSFAHSMALRLPSVAPPTSTAANSGRRGARRRCRTDVLGIRF